MHPLQLSQISPLTDQHFYFQLYNVGFESLKLSTKSVIVIKYFKTFKQLSTNLLILYYIIV